MQRKRNQWVINAEDPKAKPIVIPPWDVQAYRESGITQTLEDKGFDFKKGDRSKPCFYVQWVGPDGEKHVSFGHTRNFRVPYRNRTGDLNPTYRAYDDKIDFVQALFGRTPENGAKNTGWRGRVYFEDAHLVAAGEKGVYRGNPVRLQILGQPKPTTYQHYLTQSSDQASQVKHWDSKDATIRGFKFYWHRPGTNYECLSPEHEGEEKHHTYVQPVFRGNVFKGRIRFENLTAAELGGLLTALDLPKGCAHMIGMGKPLGLGSIRIKDLKVYRTDRQERYNALFDDGGKLSTGAIAVEDLEGFKDAFAREVYPEVQTVAELWGLERFQELQSMLTFEGLPGDWEHRTRYLFFGRVGRESINEYTSVPEPGRKPKTEKRRVLPRPSYVLKKDVPNDPLPPFPDVCAVRNKGR